MIKIISNLKKNNSGSAIVTVLVVVLVISVLATTILYLAFSNFKMKKTEQKNKESFYESETTLEEIKINLLYMASDAAEKAYINTLTEYANMTADVRKAYYYNGFITEFEKNWNSMISASAPGISLSTEEKLNKAIKSLYSYTVGKNEVIFVPSSGSNPSTGSVVDKTHSGDGYIIIRGVYLTYIENSYVSKVQTDFLISAPEFEFAVETDSSGTETEQKKTDMSNCVQYYNWVKK